MEMWLYRAGPRPAKRLPQAGCASTMKDQQTFGPSAPACIYWGKESSRYTIIGHESQYVAGISPQQRTHARWYELHNGQDLGKLAATTSTAIVCPLRGSERGLWTNGPLDASVNPTARAGRSKSAVAARPRRTLAESYHTTSISLHQPGFRACASSSCTTRRMPKLYTRCAG